MALNSKSYLKIVDLLCEGEIEGIVNRGEEKGVYLDEVRVTQKDVDDNLVRFGYTKGVTAQPCLDDQYVFGSTVKEVVAVGESVGKSYEEELDDANLVKKRDYGPGSVIKKITDLDVDRIQLVLSVPALFSTAVEGLARGERFPAKIRFKVFIQSYGSSYQEIKTIVSSKGLNEDTTFQVTEDGNIFSGISTNGYQFKTAPIQLEGKGPWNVKIEKLEFGKTDGQKEQAFEIRYINLDGNKLFQDVPKMTPLQSGRRDVLQWDHIIELKTANVGYDYSACVAMTIAAEKFNTLPARAYDVKGRKVRIPSNAVVLSEDNNLQGSLEFISGVEFDGNLTEDLFWTTCPVCCFYDMLTNSRYGAGDFIGEDNMSWVDLIDIAKYCNQKVSDGTSGGEEPRFAINTSIASQADAYNVIQDLASVFRGITFWRSDTVQLSADHGNLDGSDLNPIHLFTNSNVVGGGFNYSGSSLKTRSTRIVVRYNDRDNLFKPNYIHIENRLDIEKYGLQTKEIIAFGCSSKTQAQRLGMWMMKSQELDGNTVEFSVGLEGLNVLPGQIFAVSDEMRQTVRYAGRVIGANLHEVDVDASPFASSSAGDKLTVVLPDGRVQTRPVASIVSAQTGAKIIVSEDFDEPPVDGASFALTETDTGVQNQKFRCISVSEGAEGTYAVIGVEHNDSIYSVVESPKSNLEFTNVGLFDKKPVAPFDLKIEFIEASKNLNRFKRAIVSWRKGLNEDETIDQGTVSFQLRYKVTASGNWRLIETTNTSIEIDLNAGPGMALFAEVSAIGPEPRRLTSSKLTGSASVPADAITTDGDGNLVEILPPDPENVQLEPVGTNQVIVSWNATASGQNLNEFVAVIRHSGKASATGIWYKSSLLRKVEARITSATLPLLEGEYFVKFENSRGIRSNKAASASISLPETFPRFNYETFAEHAIAFPGQKDGVYYDRDFGGLVLDGDASFDAEVGDVDGLTAQIDSIFGIQKTEGTYYFGGLIDFGSKFSADFKRVLDAVGAYRANTFDDRLDLIDTWADFDGDVADDTNVKLYLRATDQAPDVYEFTDVGGDSLEMENGDNLVLGSVVNKGAANEPETGFGEWVPLENTNYVGRQFELKAILSTQQVDQTPVVQELGTVVEFETRTEHSRIISSGLGSRFVPFDKAFYIDGDTKVSVGITAYGLLSEDYFVMSEPTSTGFTIAFKGTFDGTEFVDRTFRYTAVGYGTAQA